MEKVRGEGGKAAPAVAIAGTLVAAAPQAHAAVRTPAKATVTERRVVLDSYTASAVSFGDPVGQGLIAGRIDMGVDFGRRRAWLLRPGSGTIVTSTTPAGPAASSS